VQALCRVAGADQARLLALWDLADQTWPHGAAVPAEPAGPAVDTAAPPGAEYRRWRAAALVSFAVIVVLLAGLLWVLPARSG
jgi:hypothetical protein